MTSDGPTQELREQSHTKQLHRGEARPVSALPGRRARGCGRGRRGAARGTYLVRTPPTAWWAGRCQWVGCMQITAGCRPIVERAEVPAWDGTPVGAQAQVAAACNLRSGSAARASASGSGASGRVRQARVGGRRRCGAAPGPQPSQAPAAQPRLRSELHASGACPAPEQQQSGASLERRQQHQRQPPEPSPQRGRGALGAPAAVAAARRQLPGLDRPELLRGDEPQRALDAGAVLAQAVLEPRQAQSLQPDFGSALRLRHGELGPPCPPPLFLLRPLPPAAPTGPTVGSGLGVPGVRERAGISCRGRRRGARGC